MAKKVLIVDDSATVRQQVAIALSQAGFAVVEAVDGVDGVAKLQANVDVAAIISDVNMPKMNGIEMVRTIKADAKNKALPIVMLTTEGAPAIMKEAQALGAKGWIVKPFKAEQLVAAMRKLVG